MVSQNHLAHLMGRWFANVVDFVILFVGGLLCINLIRMLGLVSDKIGAFIVILFAALYLFLRDGLMGGQSFGKKLAGIKVIDSRSELPCKFWQSFIRNLLVMIPFGYFLIFFGGKKQHLGDRAAHTLVCRK